MWLHINITCHGLNRKYRSYIILFIYQNTACIQEFVRAERAFTKRDDIILSEESVVGDKK